MLPKGCIDLETGTMKAAVREKKKTLLDNLAKAAEMPLTFLQLTSK